VAAALVQLIGADSTVVGSTFTDDQGAFRIPRSPPPRAYLYVSAAGFKSIRAPLADLYAGGSNVLVLLEPAPIGLATVEVRTTRSSRWLESVGYYARQRTGLGAYVTREAIENQHRTAGRATDILRRVSGVVHIDEFDIEAKIYLRAPQISFGPPCPAEIYVQGLSNGKLLPRIHPSDIEAIEVYRGPAEVPPAYGGADAACGVILVWLRTGGP